MEQRASPYIQQLSITDFLGIKSGALHFLDPQGTQETPLRNINLILGGNGDGKTSILKAIVVGLMAGILPHSGFPPFPLIRQGCEFSMCELALRRRDEIITVRSWINRRGDRQEMGSDIPGDDRGHSYFLCAYGASSRRLSSEDSPAPQGSSLYQRVAGLFQNDYPLQSWSHLKQAAQTAPRRAQILSLLNQLLQPIMIEILPDKGSDRGSDQHPDLVLADGTPISLQDLSHGPRSYLAILIDLLTHLCQKSPEPPQQIPGIILIDHLEQNLHPNWQLVVLENLSRAFPKIQFIITTHSPILVASVPPGQIHVCERHPTSHDIVIHKPSLNFYKDAYQEILHSRLFGVQPRSLNAQQVGLGHNFLLRNLPPQKPSRDNQINPVIVRAEKRASEIIKEAQATADQIVQTGHQTLQHYTEAIHEQFQALAQQVYAYAHKEGYHAGYQQALADARGQNPPATEPERPPTQ